MRSGATDLRGLLLALVVVGMLGVTAELVLLGHYEEFQQWIPLSALGVGLVSAGAVWMRPRHATVLFFRLVMAAFVATGLTGIYLHYRGNAEFELEMDASLGGWQLFLESVHGATPALAPAAMMHLGLLGLLYTWRHTSLRGARASGDDAGTT